MCPFLTNSELLCAFRGWMCHIYSTPLRPVQKVTWWVGGKIKNYIRPEDYAAASLILILLKTVLIGQDNRLLTLHTIDMIRQINTIIKMSTQNV
jgi:hypothetical protein